jgi:hypothetical protein
MGGGQSSLKRKPNTLGLITSKNPGSEKPKPVMPTHPLRKRKTRFSKRMRVSLQRGIGKIICKE